MVNLPTREQLNAKAPRINLFAQRATAAAASSLPSATTSAAPTDVRQDRPLSAAHIAPPPMSAPGSRAAQPASSILAPVSAAPAPLSLFGPRGAFPGPSSFAPTSCAPATQQLLPPAITNKLLVSHRQKGNKVIENIQNVPWEYASIVADYQLGQSTVALFLSLRYHLLHPQYILRRVEELKGSFTLCVVLVLVDMEDHQRPIQEVTRAMFPKKCTVVCAWSNLEAARWLETLKAYQSKPVDMLQQRPTGDYTATLHECLSAIRAINKSDVLTLSTSVGSLREILLASEEQLALCPGLGEKKIRLLQQAASDPFIVQSRAAPTAPDRAAQSAE